MTCLGCGAENRDGRRFCSKCGAALSMTCSSCGFINDPGDQFCGGCGQRVNAATAEPAKQKTLRATLSGGSSRLCSDWDRHRTLSPMPTGPAARHRDPRPDVPAHARRPGRGHVVIGPAPARARPPDPRPGSCATPLLRARRPSPARLGLGALSASRSPGLIATFQWRRRRP